MTETVTKLLQRFVEAIDPENAQISKLQKDLDDARLKENEIKKVNPILEEEIKQAQSRQEGLVNLKNGIEKLIKENIGILDQEGRTEIYHNLVKQEKESYDNYEKQIKENKEKIATNEKILEDNSDILNFCGDEIQTAKKNIDNIVSKLKPIFEATGSENYIEIGKAKELISSLNVFSESEIGEILRYVSFPVPELKKIYEEYQLNKDDSKKTSMKQLFSDAQEAADKKEIEEKKQVKKVDKKEISKFETIILGGGIHASEISGLSFLKKNINRLEMKDMKMY